MNDFLPAVLPDADKQELCENLLAEFGVTHVRTNPRSGEMIHGCLVTPYHQDQERNPTASLNFQKLTYNCLGCGAHGGLLWFIATLRKCSTKEAYQWLAESHGMSTSTMDTEQLIAAIERFYNHELSVEIIPTYSPRILEPWLRYAHHPYLTDGAPDLGVKGRHIPGETLDRMKVGWDDDIDRIVIPHFWKGDLVGWQSRALHKHQSPKYQSTPDFPRHSTIYNFDPTRRYDDVMVVESPMSVLRHLHQQDQLVATFGTEVTDQQVKLLARADRVTFWPDPDEPGTNAMLGRGDRKGVLEKLSKYTDVFVVPSPWDVDPADINDEDFDDLRARRVPWVLWKPYAIPHAYETR